MAKAKTRIPTNEEVRFLKQELELFRKDIERITTYHRDNKWEHVSDSKEKDEAFSLYIRSTKERRAILTEYAGLIGLVEFFDKHQEAPQKNFMKGSGSSTGVQEYLKHKQSSKTG